MADITSSRIQPLSDGGGDNGAPESRKPNAAKLKAPSKPAPVPLVETDDKDEEIHQLDELA